MLSRECLPRASAAGAVLLLATETLLPPCLSHPEWRPLATSCGLAEGTSPCPSLPPACLPAQASVRYLCWASLELTPMVLLPSETPGVSTAPAHRDALPSFPSHTLNHCALFPHPHSMEGGSGAGSNSCCVPARVQKPGTGTERVWGMNAGSQGTLLIPATVLTAATTTCSVWTEGA